MYVGVYVCASVCMKRRREREKSRVEKRERQRFSGFPFVCLPLHCGGYRASHGTVLRDGEYGKGGRGEKEGEEREKRERMTNSRTETV